MSDDDQTHDDDQPSSSRSKKIKTTVLVTVLPVLTTAVTLAHELWQWTHGQ